MEVDHRWDWLRSVSPRRWAREGKTHNGCWTIFLVPVEFRCWLDGVWWTPGAHHWPCWPVPANFAGWALGCEGDVTITFQYCLGIDIVIQSRCCLMMLFMSITSLAQSRWSCMVVVAWHGSVSDVDLLRLPHIKGKQRGNYISSHI